MRQKIKPVVIGFGYRARQGKDTAARAIREARGAEFDIRRYSFAAALKREVAALALAMPDGMAGLCALCGVEYEKNAEPDPDCQPFGKQRRLLQWYGTDFRRRLDPDYWVRQIEKQILVECPRVALVTDMRFRNEAEMVKRLGGRTVKVERRGYALPYLNHASECDLAIWPFDFEISVGDGQINELRDRALNLFDGAMVAVNGRA